IRLSELKSQGVIDEWFDSRDPACGTNNEVTNLYFETADIILLLVRPYFVASDSRYNYEMERAIRKHENGEARVIPVILDPDNWQGIQKNGTVLELFPGNPDIHGDIFREITSAICAAVGEIRGSSIPELKLAGEA
ncbi:MAG: hypothetical protein ACM3Q2_12360, partial [Syntrophothermus sp.]